MSERPRHGLGKFIDQAKPVVSSVISAAAEIDQQAATWLDTELAQVQIGSEPQSVSRREALGTLLVAGVGVRIIYHLGQEQGKQSSKPSENHRTPLEPAPPISSAPSKPDARVPQPQAKPTEPTVEATRVRPASFVESASAKKRRLELAQKLEKEFPLMESQKNLEASALPFLDDDANEAAKEIGITHAGQLFDIPPHIIPHLKAGFSNEPLKIFSPGVDRHTSMMAQMADKTRIPRILLEIHEQIESGGNEQAGDQNGGDGQGLMQVEDQNFPPNTPREKKLDPAYNVNQAIEHVIKVNKRMAENPDLAWKKTPQGYKKSEAYTWLRIAQAFNAGNTVLQYESAYDNRITLGTQQYFDHVLRFAIVAEVASKLKAKGFDDAQVAAKLTSYEVEARANVLEKAMLDQPDSDTYKKVMEVLGKATIDAREASTVTVHGGESVYSAYTHYLAETNDGQRNIQVNPALRIWLNHDPSRGLWTNINNDLSNWQEMFSHAGIKVWKPATPTPEASPPDVVTVQPVETPEPVAPPHESMPGEGKVVIPDVYIYNERNSRWWDVEGDEEATCGPVSVAMGVSTLLQQRITPDVIDGHFQAKDMRRPTGSTYFRALRRMEDGKFEVVDGKEGNVPQFLRDQYGLKVEQLFDILSSNQGKRDIELRKNSEEQNPRKVKADLEKWKKHVDGGKLIIASAANAMFVKETLPNGAERFPNGADHIFLIEDIDPEDLTFTIVDPWNGVRRKGVPADYMRTPLYAYAIGR